MNKNLRKIFLVSGLALLILAVTMPIAGYFSKQLDKSSKPYNEVIAATEDDEGKDSEDSTGFTFDPDPDPDEKVENTKEVEDTDWDENKTESVTDSTKSVEKKLPPEQPPPETKPPPPVTPETTAPPPPPPPPVTPETTAPPPPPPPPVTPETTAPPPPPPPPPACDNPQWTCTEWSICSETHEQTRICNPSCTPADQSAQPRNESQTCEPSVADQTANAINNLITSDDDIAAANAALEAAVGASDAFQDILGAAPVTVAPPPFAVFASQNDVQRAVDEIQPQLQQRTEQMESEGRSEEEINTEIAHEVARVTRKISREKIEKKLGIRITKNTQGMEDGGVSHEIKAMMDLPPDATPEQVQNILAGCKKNEKPEDKSNKDEIGSNINPGAEISISGFVLTMAGRPQMKVEVYAIDTAGNRILLKTGPISDNGIGSITIEQTDLAGKLVPDEYYIIEMVEAGTSRVVSWSFAGTALAANALGAGDKPDASVPVLVKVVGKTDIPQPVIKSIEGIEVNDALKNIKITRTADGIVEVTGLADISTIVMGTFKSAVFTSAILADVDNGSFEVVSPKPLESGDHEVVIYSTRPGTTLQSRPIKLKFSIVETAQAASGGEVTSERPSATEEKQFPTTIVIIIAGVVVVAVGAGIYFKKKSAA